MNAVHKLRLNEIKSFPRYLLRNGALPPKPVPAGTVRLPNPFLPHKNPRTGRWSPPKYSLRRQADLVKKAKASDMLHLLPPGLKFDTTGLEVPAVEKESEEIWDIPVDWEGQFTRKKVPGSDIGARLYAGKKRMFKGHKWERLKRKQLARRRMLLKDMNQRMFNFKHYHKWRKPHPTAKPKVTGYTKIPF